MNIEEDACVRVVKYGAEQLNVPIISDIKVPICIYGELKNSSKPNICVSGHYTSNRVSIRGSGAGNFKNIAQLIKVG